MKRLLSLAACVLLGLSGCQTVQEWFAPQSKIVAICESITSQNAGVTCIKEAYSLLEDTALTVNERYSAGRITAATRESYRARLSGLYNKVTLAETAVLLGNLGDAQGQMDALIGLLEGIEGEVK